MRSQQLTSMIIVVLSIILLLVQCRNGIDFAQGYTDSIFTCFSQQSVTYVILQAYKFSGTVNTDATQNLKTAKNRGFTTDILMHSCASKDPISQVNEMINAIPGDLYDTVWLRVEDNLNPGCGWSGNTPGKNCAYLRSLAAAVQANGKKVGVYSTVPSWKSAFQSYTFCPNLSNLLLWYGYNDSSTSFSNFLSFGGWTTPSMKTFIYGYTMCGVSVNTDWRP